MKGRSRRTKSDRLNQAKEYALRFISYRPRTIREVSRKLSDRGYDDEIISLVVAFLKEYNFLDDAAFAHMWLRSRTTGKLCGRHRIAAELRQKGVEREIIEQCLLLLSDEKEEEMARTLVEAKCRRTGYDYKKLKGFLIRRGFNGPIIEKVLSACGENSSDEPR